MKGLDTGALLEILEGTPAARKEVRRLRGEELATTEVNMTELALLALRGASRTRAERMAALTRLRRRVTVLPVEGRAFDVLARSASGAVAAGPALVLAMLATFEAAGCEELLTAEPGQIGGKWRFKVRKFAK
jgi:predicted nucleic acid-binding protein